MLRCRPCRRFRKIFCGLHRSMAEYHNKPKRLQWLEFDTNEHTIFIYCVPSEYCMPTGSRADWLMCTGKLGVNCRYVQSRPLGFSYSTAEGQYVILGGLLAQAISKSLHLKRKERPLLHPGFECMIIAHASSKPTSNVANDRTMECRVSIGIKHTYCAPPLCLR